jgi:glutamate/tyrosine decarboxylase-like PLP-dependent enzyme
MLYTASKLGDAAGRVNEQQGWEVVIHVDGASGAFVAPFLVSPE